MFKKILIANRGEIACRVIKTARAMGVRTVAVYSDIDAQSLHVALADEAVGLGGQAARENYLDGQKIIRAALQTGAEAIHPGYGFLSENADFAESCAREGLVFIGPPPAAIRAMGLKDAAKRLMEQAGVPILPGYHGAEQSDAALSAAASKIGFPVLIKAVAGGGGKGMRQVRHASEFDEGLAAARREAKAAFGDDRVLIEKYLVKPRHIEIQLFADAHGHAVYLHERDCSVQRRHQKVVEEAPAPGMAEDMRRAMGEAAVAAARAVGYQGAGTVEFIADVAEGLRPDRFYFMEMNTRLQVEHPVTEMITGLDLVEWQLRVAAGEALPLAQKDIPLRGHAFEARLYAEDPNKDFLPSSGRLEKLVFPRENENVRIDAGVREGDSVSSFYDPMIAKLIVWDQDRDRARARMQQALSDTRIGGLGHNLEFLHRLMGHSDFVADHLDTGFIERHRRALIPGPQPLDKTALMAAGLGLLLERQRSRPSLMQASPWDYADGWRLNGWGQETMVFDHDGGRIALALRYGQGRIVARHDDFEAELSGEMDERGELDARLNGHRLKVGFWRKGRAVTIFKDGLTHSFYLHDPLEIEEAEDYRGDKILSPMPGRVVRVAVEAGEKVVQGQPLAIIEAMKMEHTVAAPRDGLIESLYYIAGDQVEEGAELMKLAEQE